MFHNILAWKPLMFLHCTSALFFTHHFLRFGSPSAVSTTGTIPATKFPFGWSSAWVWKWMPWPSFQDLDSYPRFIRPVAPHSPVMQDKVIKKTMSNLQFSHDTELCCVAKGDKDQANQTAAMYCPLFPAVTKDSSDIPQLLKPIPPPPPPRGLMIRWSAGCPRVAGKLLLSIEVRGRHSFLL